MNKKLFKKIAGEVENNFGEGGLSDGIYYDFALECAKRYFNEINKPSGDCDSYSFGDCDSCFHFNGAFCELNPKGYIKPCKFYTRPISEMTKTEAIKWIKEIQTGKFDRNEIVDQIPRGSIAVERWYEPEFAIGMEYGVIMALMKAYDIKKDEL